MFTVVRSPLTHPVMWAASSRVVSVQRVPSRIGAVHLCPSRSRQAVRMWVGTCVGRLFSQGIRGCGCGFVVGVCCC